MPKPKEKVKRNSKIYTLRQEGMSLRDISKIVRVSHTRVRTVLKAMERKNV